MKDAFGVFAFSISRALAAPLATVVAFLIVIAWMVSGPQLHYDNRWQLIMNTLSSVLTLLMVFILNYAESRHTTAINAKLDTIILALERADNRVIGMEHMPHTEAEVVSQEVRAQKDA